MLARCSVVVASCVMFLCTKNHFPLNNNLENNAQCERGPATWPRGWAGSVRNME